MTSVGDIIRKKYTALGVAIGRPLRTSGAVDDTPPLEGGGGAVGLYWFLNTWRETP